MIQKIGEIAFYSDLKARNDEIKEELLKFYGR